jgi:hypothetical protein
MQREIGAGEDELAGNARGRRPQVVGSTVMMEAERGEPSSDIRPRIRRRDQIDDTLAGPLLRKP